MQRTNDASIKPGCKPALVRLICASSCSVTHRPDASPDLITTSLLPKTLNCITLVRPKLEYPFLCNPTTGTENRANESPYLQLCLLIFANFTVSISVVGSVVVGSHRLANPPPPVPPKKRSLSPSPFCHPYIYPNKGRRFRPVIGNTVVDLANNPLSTWHRVAAHLIIINYPIALLHLPS